MTNTLSAVHSISYSSLPEMTPERERKPKRTERVLLEFGKRNRRNRDKPPNSSKWTE